MLFVLLISLSFYDHNIKPAKRGIQSDVELGMERQYVDAGSK
jgi:hypothetical protein